MLPEMTAKCHDTAWSQWLSLCRPSTWDSGDLPILLFLVLGYPCSTLGWVPKLHWMTFKAFDDEMCYVAMYRFLTISTNIINCFSFHSFRKSGKVIVHLTQTNALLTPKQYKYFHPQHIRVEILNIPGLRDTSSRCDPKPSAPRQNGWHRPVPARSRVVQLAEGRSGLSCGAVLVAREEESYGAHRC